MSIRQLSPALWSYRHTNGSGPTGPGGPGRTFVLAPFAGGSAYSLAEWLPVLVRGGDRAFMLQYPGRGPRADEPVPATLTELADEAARELRHHSAGPLVLIGHSMGAMLAYEVAHRLQVAGRETALLVVSAARPPHLVGLDPVRLARLTTGEWVRRMLADGFAGADEMPPDMLAAAVSVLRSDCLLVAEHAAVADHVAQGRLLRCPVLALGGDADAGVDPEDLGEWAAVTKGRTSTHVLSGGHFYYRNRLDEIGELIERALS